MIVRARAVVTMAGAPLENGAIVIEGGRITEVGLWSEIAARGGGEVVDLGECVLLPGLINAHCHLDYTLLRGALPPPASFTAWIKSINAQKASLAPDDYVRSIEAGLAEAARFGTSTIANLEAFPELIERVAEVAAADVVVCGVDRRPRGGVGAATTLGKLETRRGDGGSGWSRLGSARAIHRFFANYIRRPRRWRRSCRSRRRRIWRSQRRRWKCFATGAGRCSIS